jgi:hypothetical protein
MSTPTDPSVKPVVATFSVKTSDGTFDSSLSITIRPEHIIRARPGKRQQSRPRGVGA